MIEGECPNCGQRYVGWALQQPQHQNCLRCGEELLITEEGKEPFQGYSPFTAEEYRLRLPVNINPQ